MNVHESVETLLFWLLTNSFVCAGGIWKEPNPISACFTDGNLVTGAAWPGHPEFLKQTLKALGATIQGGDKKVLMLCGVSSHFLLKRKVIVFFSLECAGLVNSGRSHSEYLVSIVITDQGLFGNVNSNIRGLLTLPVRKSTHLSIYALCWFYFLLGSHIH